MSHTVEISGNDWEIQKMCKDVEDYELVIEKQKTDWQCEQNHQSWKWIVSYHGSIVASGCSNSQEEASEKAVNNVPK